MLDVHPPDHKLHGVGDFFLHLFTITVGLFIALSLEGLVERVHHNHLREEATANITQELKDNRKNIQDATVVLQGERDNLLGVLAFAAARKANQPYDVDKLSVSFNIAALHDASWNTAATTGGLSYMDYGRVENFAAVYKLQEKYLHLQDETLEEFIQMQSYVVTGQDPMQIPVAEVTAAEPTVRRALAHLKAMQEVGASLSKNYDVALKPEQP